MKYLYLILSSITVAYAIVIIFIYFYQRNLLYHPSENNYQNDEIKFEYEEVNIEVEGEIELKSWLIKKDFTKLKTLLIFHGNAGDLSNRIYKLNELNKLDINILLISWRGFNGNKGSPTEKNLYKDAYAAIKWLNKKKINNNQIILYGESLGTGVAIEMAKNRNFNSVILESPFTSIENSAKIQKFLAKFATFCKNQQNNSAIFNEKIEIRERCKGVHCVDLGESFRASIYLQNLASIQPRTSLFNFFNFNPALVI